MSPSRAVTQAGRSTPAHVLFIAALGASLLLACGTDIQSGIDSANDLLYRKEYIQAERLLRKLLKRIEDQGDLDEDEEQQRLWVLDRLGATNALYLHNYAQAIADYGQLVRLYPKTDQALTARAAVADIYQHKLGDVETAIDEYQKLVLEFPNRAETRWAQLQIAQSYFHLKNYDQARAEAQALTKRWPDSPEAAQARFQIANSYYLQERYTDAVETYESILKGKPDDQLKALVLFELGNCYQELGQGDKALAYLYASLPDHPNPMLVQRKITRIRRRLVRTAPASSILTDGYIGARLPRGNATLASTGAGSADASPPAPKGPKRAKGDEARDTPASKRKPAAEGASSAASPAAAAEPPVAEPSAATPAAPESAPEAKPAPAAPAAPAAPPASEEKKPAAPPQPEAAPAPAE